MTKVGRTKAGTTKAGTTKAGTTKAGMRKAGTAKAAARKANVWKLPDAKARFSELVRKARTGAPQTVIVHDEAAVVVVDSRRFEIRPKARGTRTMADFIEPSRKYRGGTEGSGSERAPTPVREQIFEGEFFDEEDED